MVDIVFDGSVTAGSVALTTAVDETDGGTGQTTYATGDVLYASASNTLSKLAAGSDGEVLTLASGVPSWAAAGGGGYPIAGAGFVNTTSSNFGGMRYFGCIQTGSDSNTSITNITPVGGLALFPIVIDQDIDVTSCQFDITSFSTGGTVHLGIYSTTNGVPDTLHTDFGSVTPTGTGLQTATFTSTTIEQGFYYIGFVIDDASTTISFNVRTQFFSNYWQNSISNSTGGYGVRITTSDYTDMPSSLTETDLSPTSNRIKIALRP